MGGAMSTDVPAQAKTVIPAKAGIHSAVVRWLDKWIPAIAGITVLVAATIAARADAAEAPPGASSCSGCHAASASVETPVPRLVGRPGAEIIAAMQQFRTGQRQATVMDRIAKGFSGDEAAAIAAWYEEQRR
jgi:cytochrome subunit of sulfide dehydrogenase